MAVVKKVDLTSGVTLNFDDQGYPYLVCSDSKGSFVRVDSFDFRFVFVDDDECWFIVGTECINRPYSAVDEYVPHTLVFTHDCRYFKKMCRFYHEYDLLLEREREDYRNRRWPND